MNTRTRTPRLITAALLAVSLALVAPALTGCGLIQDAVERATGGDVDLGGKSVPEDFPSEVPLIDGEVLSGASAGNEDGKIWNVTIKVADASVFDEIKAQLEGAGFESSEIGGSGDQGSTGTFTKEPYGVFVVVAGGDTAEGWVANYTVTSSTQ
jgi:hypothetical protein